MAGIALTLDTTGLLKWAKIAEELAIETRPAVARALNAFGEVVVDSAARRIADNLDLDLGDVRSRIVVYEADAANIAWEMDASQVALGQEGGRPWPGREGGGFDDEVLLDIVGYLDCCELCEQIAGEGPYTASQINNFAAEWANFVPAPPAPGRERTNLLHPNCYCGTNPWKRPASARVGVTYGQQTFETTPLALGRHLAEEVEGVVQLVVARNP